MGFKDADWAYKLELPTARKVILAAIAHATDDRNHQTYVSQKTLAGMVGMSVSTVNVSVRALDAAGIITRTRRSGVGGYRTTDVITVNTTYSQQAKVREANIGDTYMGETGHLLPDDDPPTSGSWIAEEINQIDQPEDQPVSGARKRGTRIPESFTITPTMVAWAREHTPLVDGKRATAMFINYWNAATGRNATKLDWEATWRNWMLKDQQTAERATAPRPWEKPVGRPPTLAEERAQLLQEAS